MYVDKYDMLNNARKVVITLERNPTLRIWSEIIRNSFTELGWKAILFETKNLSQIPECDVCFVLFPHHYSTFVKQNKTFYVCWQAEQIPMHCDRGGGHAARRFAQVKKYYKCYDLHLTTGADRAKYLSSKGYHFLPLDFGFSPILRCNIPNNPKEYDVLFYGSPSSRRSKMIKRLENDGISVYPRRHGVVNAKRVIAWSKSKIVLNVHYAEQKLFEALRVVTCLANQLFVISENTCETHPFQDGEHLVFSSYNDMPQTIKRFLEDEAARKLVALNGHNFVCNETSITRNLEKILHKMHKRRIYL